MSEISKLHIYVQSFDGFPHPFVLEETSSFNERVSFFFCGGGVSILLRWSSLYHFVVQASLSIFCKQFEYFSMLASFCQKHDSFYSRHVFGYPFECYFVKIHYFLIVKFMELLNPNKVLYDGVTVFNIYLHFTLKRKYLIITMKDRIVLFLL